MVRGQIKKLVLWLLGYTSDGIYVRFKHYLPLLKGHWPGILHIRRPRSFSEKIQYLKIHIERLIPDAHLYVDKLAVRDYVADTFGDQRLVPLLGSWDRAEDIDWSALPDRFVIKVNHGTGFNIIVNDKAALDTAWATEQLKAWLEIDYSKVGRSKQHRKTPPRLLAEQLLGEKGKAPIDYKFFCFDGRMELLMVVVDRHTDRRDLFLDREWNRLPVRKHAPSFPPDREIARPIVFDEMVRVAERLALPFFFVRVDLYEIDGLVYFGELTFTSGGGAALRPAEWNRKLGDLINLPR